MFAVDKRSILLSIVSSSHETDDLGGICMKWGESKGIDSRKGFDRISKESSRFLLKGSVGVAMI